MIFYFSGTGNTRWAARTLAERTGERLLSIPGELRERHVYQLADGERIGFCFPVHGWQPPHIVREFIRCMDIRNAEGHYCYAVATCGDNIGLTMELLGKELRLCGLRLDSVFSLIMPESYVCLPFMYTDTPEREREKIAQAAVDLDAYARLIVERKAGEVHTQRGAAPWFLSHVIGAYFNKQMITDRKFTVDADRCIHCGRCQQACPTGDVSLNDLRLPQWRHNGSCTCCLSCYHHCPVHAINYGRITRRRGQYFFRNEE